MSTVTFILIPMLVFILNVVRLWLRFSIQGLKGVDLVVQVVVLLLGLSVAMLPSVIVI